MASPFARARRAARRPLLRHPGQVVVVAFAVVIALGTVLLMLPVSREGAASAPPLVALFTATSAVCVTGLVVVDTPSYWSDFGEGVVLALIQVGGFGIMTLASLLGLFVWRRLGLRSRMTATAERGAGLGEVRTVIKGVLAITVLFEATLTGILTLRFAMKYDMPWSEAGYQGLFHAVSAFNNAGFSLYPDSLSRFVTDPWVCLPVAIAVIAGGLGFPVWVELLRQSRGRRQPWTVHTKMTLLVTGMLLVAGTVFVTANEWRNPGTLGGLSEPGRVLAGFFQAVMPRTAGFNTVEIGEMREGTLLATNVLMFIGGGTGGTAGGIKVTTFFLLFFVILAEVRGERDVRAFRHRMDPRVIRQALTVALLGIGAVMSATILVLELTRLSTTEVLFEVTSAFGTVGLSTGITPELPGSAQLILVGLMFLGRLGPITLVSALALRDRERLHRLPEGRPLIG